tara:strand:+ start:574 stop:825 length:252 start_codon:yes stop_codon:yes gene_type:complete
MTSSKKHNEAQSFLTAARTCLEDASFATSADALYLCAARALDAAGFAMEVCDTTDDVIFAAAQRVMDAALEYHLAANAMRRAS